MYNARFARRGSRLALAVDDAETVTASRLTVVPEVDEEKVKEKKVEPRTDPKRESAKSVKFETPVEERLAAKPSIEPPEPKASVPETKASAPDPKAPPLPLPAASRGPQIAAFVAEGEREIFQKFAAEKESLVFRVHQLEEDLRRARELYDRGWPVERGRWAEFESFVTEVKLLRLENTQLRNLTPEQSQLKEKRLVEKLQAQVNSLQTENTYLRRRLDELEHPLPAAIGTPPVDVYKLQRVPLEIPAIDKARVMQVLEEEWTRVCSASRHGKAAPLKSPFERRRYP